MPISYRKEDFSMAEYIPSEGVDEKTLKKRRYRSNEKDDKIDNAGSHVDNGASDAEAVNKDSEDIGKTKDSIKDVRAFTDIKINKNADKYKKPEGRDTSNRKYKNKEVGDKETSGRGLRKRKEAERKRKNRRTLVAIAVVAAAAIGVTVFAVNGGFNNNEPVTPPTSSQSNTSDENENTSESAGSSATESQVSSTLSVNDDGTSGYMDGSIYIWKKTGFEMFYGDNNSAASYANAISSYKKKLGSDIKVYSMLVPNHTEFGLPERLRKELMCNSQRENLDSVYSSFTEDVVPVDIYNVLSNHMNEYIYFNTDHHWTGLGGYYAYTEFAKTAGLEALSLSSMEKKSIEGFVGSFINSTKSNSQPNGNEELRSNLDTVEYYEIDGDFEVKTTGENGSSDFSEISLYYPHAEGGANTYGVFLWGDHPLTVIKNNNIKDGRKIAVIKESYGNAFIPYLAYNYEEVYVIDFRYYEENLKKLCDEKGITEVIFANGIMSANSAFQIEKMDKLFD